MGLGKLVSKAKLMWRASQALDAFKEDVMAKGFVNAVKALGLVAFPIIVAKVTAACPGLGDFNLVIAGLVGVVGAALSFRRSAGPTKSVGAGVGTAGLLTVVYAQVQVELVELCGPDFLAQLPVILASAATVAIGAYLTHRKEDAAGQ